MKLSILTPILTMTLLGCASTAPTPPRVSGEAVMQADRDFAAATKARGIEGWVAYFAPNGSQVDPEGKFVTGPEAIRGFMGPVFARPGFELKWWPTAGEISTGGKLGYTWGRYERVLNGEVVGTGNYATVWEKQPDGSWKVLFDTGDADPKA
jgi:ketosteroid isomerase-like protein